MAQRKRTGGDVFERDYDEVMRVFDAVEDHPAYSPPDRRVMRRACDACRRYGEVNIVSRNDPVVDQPWVLTWLAYALCRGGACVVLGPPHAGVADVFVDETCSPINWAGGNMELITQPATIVVSCQLEAVRDWHAETDVVVVPVSPVHEHNRAWALDRLPFDRVGLVIMLGAAFTPEERGRVRSRCRAANVPFVVFGGSRGDVVSD